MVKDSVVFFGSGPVAVKSLIFLKNKFEIEAVITKPATLQEMTQIVPGASSKAVKNKEELTQFISTKPFKSHLGIIVDFGIIVDRAVIDYFPLGIVNSHFSLLPEWRGADPITFAILSGQSKTGVSLMLIDEQLDTGKLLTQKSLAIPPEATTPSLTADLINLSNALLFEYLPLYTDGKIKPRAQPHPDRATHSRKLTKTDGVINWTKPADQIEREIRAYINWPKSQTRLAEKDITILKAHTIDEQGEPGTVVVTGKELMVYCGKDALIVEMLKPAGKREMSSQEFLAGYRRFL